MRARMLVARKSARADDIKRCPTTGAFVVSYCPSPINYTTANNARSDADGPVTLSGTGQERRDISSMRPQNLSSVARL